MSSMAERRSSAGSNEPFELVKVPCPETMAQWRSCMAWGRVWTRPRLPAPTSPATTGTPPTKRVRPNSRGPSAMDMITE